VCFILSLFFAFFAFRSICSWRKRSLPGVPVNFVDESFFLPPLIVRLQAPAFGKGRTASGVTATSDEWEVSG